MHKIQYLTITIILLLSNINAQSQGTWDHFLLNVITSSNEIFGQPGIVYDSTHDVMISGTHFIYLQNDSIFEYYSKTGSFSTPDYISVGHDGTIWHSGTWSGPKEYSGGVWYDRGSWDLVNGGINELQSDKNGLVWFTVAFGDGIYTYDGTTPVKTYSFDPNIIRQDSKGDIWAAGTGHNANAGAIHHYNGSEWNSFTIPAIITSEYTITDMVLGIDGKIWIGTSSIIYSLKDSVGGILCRDSAGNWSHISIDEGLPTADVTSLALDSKNGLWIGTSKGLAYMSDSGIFTWDALDYGTDTTLFEHSLVSDVAIDPQDRVWIASRGVHRFTPDTLLVSSIQNTNSIKPSPISVSLINNRLTISKKNSTIGNYSIDIMTLNGRTVFNKGGLSNQPQFIIDIPSSVSRGIYVLKTDLQGIRFSQQILLQ